MAVLAIFASMIEKTRELKSELELVYYILYPVIFKDHTEALLDARSKVNTMSQAFVS